MVTWRWRLLGARGEEIGAESAPAVPEFSNQSDAESWIGEHWQELADAGVAAVSLLDGATVVYGPMPLEPSSG